MIASVITKREWKVICARVEKRGVTVLHKRRWYHWEEKGTLLKQMIDSFQSYYELAVRNNVGNREEM